MSTFRVTTFDCEAEQGFIYQFDGLKSFSEAFNQCEMHKADSEVITSATRYTATGTEVQYHKDVQ